MQVKTAGLEVLQRRIEPGQETMSWIVQAESRSNSKDARFARFQQRSNPALEKEQGKTVGFPA